MNTQNRFILGGVISVLAVVAAILHAFFHSLKIDETTAVLLGLALIPWVAEFLSSAELPGGWKVQFRDIKVQQALQEEEISALKFLVKNFLGADEFQHLAKLAGDAPFIVDAKAPTVDTFKAELRRLRSLGLIRTKDGKSISDVVKESGDLKRFIEPTLAGRDYLRMREEPSTRPVPATEARA